MKLKCFKGVPEGGVPEGRVVFDRFPRVWDRRFGRRVALVVRRGYRPKRAIEVALVVRRGYSALQKSD